MTAAGVSQLGYLVLGVSDVDRWLSFASDVLGMSVERRHESGSAALRMDDHAYRIVIEPSTEDDVLAVGWQVAGPPELASVARALQAAGCSTDDVSELASARRVGDIVRFRDPSGLATEIYWGPELVLDEPFVPGRPIHGFKTGALGLGHVVLAVDDVDAMSSLYVDVLGFDLSDHGNGPFTFLRCNPRHHSIAFGPARVSTSGTRLMHFMVEMESLDDVGSAYDICQRRDIPIAITLGRHTNDRMVSFYAWTPSPFRVECGWGGLLVGQDWQVPRYSSREIWGHERVESSVAHEAAHITGTEIRTSDEGTHQ